MMKNDLDDKADNSTVLLLQARIDQLEDNVITLANALAKTDVKIAAVLAAYDKSVLPSRFTQLSDDMRRVR